MKREIEAKIHLTDDEFLKILNRILLSEKNQKIRAENLKILFKTDEYFSQFENIAEREKQEPRVIRLRTEKSVNTDELKKNRNENRFAKISEVNEFLEKIKSRNQNIKKSSETENAFAPAEKSDSATENLSASEKNLAAENLADEKSYFTIKNKRFECGTEINCEDETLVENPEVLRNFFKATRFKKWFSKEKTSFSFFVKKENGFCVQDKDSVQNQEPVPSCRENVPLCRKSVPILQDSVHCPEKSFPPSQDFVLFHAELEIVNGLKYLEIECTDEKIPEKNAFCGLDEIFLDFGLDVSKKDVRSWVEIIQNLPKNKNQGSENADA